MPNQQSTTSLLTYLLSTALIDTYTGSQTTIYIADRLNYQQKIYTRATEDKE